MRLGSYYRAQILKLFDIKANGNRVLDVGCYDGYWLSTQKAKNKYALDIDVVKSYRNINYIKASALKIPFKSNYFDQVFAFDVLEHIESNEVLDLLLKINKLGTTVMLATHASELVNKIKKRVITLEKGQIILEQQDRMHRGQRCR